MTPLTDIPLGDFVHPALFYGYEEEYLETLVPFITEGLSQGQPVAASVPAARVALLRDALGSDADRMLLLDMEDVGRNPGRIIPTVLRKFADAQGPGHVRIIGEPIWAWRSETEYPACAQHEALINLAFAGRDVTIVCPYDTSALDEKVIADAFETHPLVWEPGRRYESPMFAPDAVVDRYNEPLRSPVEAARMIVADLLQLRDARRFVRDHARRQGADQEQAERLELIAAELVTNSLVHTDAGCSVAVWRQDELVVCDVTDLGYLADPLAGRRPPTEGGGIGLLLVNKLADLVRTHTSPEGTTVHAFVSLK